MSMIASIAPSDGAAGTGDTRPRLRWLRVGWLALLVVALVAALAVIDRDGPAVAALPTPVVSAAPPPVRDVSGRDDDVGRSEASKSAAVTAPKADPATSREAAFTR